MLDYRETIQSCYEFIERSEVQQKHPYAYEIRLVTGIDETALTSRTAGTLNFNRDIESAVERAKQSHGTLRIEVYGGKSSNAKHLNTYTVNVSGWQNPQEKPLQRAEVATIIGNELAKQNQTSRGDDLGGLLGMLTDEKTQSQVKGLFGLFNALSGGDKELERVNYQKQLDDFKYETRYNSLEERYERLRTENAELRAEKDRYYSENKDLKTEKVDLENRLAGYAPNELMKRVAIGVVTGIGTKVLTNSPKTAELFGLSAEELKGALGMASESEFTTNETIPDTDIEITDLGASSPEDRKKAEIIKKISDALKTWELNEVAKIANIVGLCLDKAERINQTLNYLNQMVVQSEEINPIELED